MPTHSRLNLSRRFALFSFILMVITATILTLAFQHVSLKQLVTMAERQNEDTAKLFRNTLWTAFEPHVVAQGNPVTNDADYVYLLTLAAELLSESDTIKIKIYDRRGLTVFSTERAQVGEDRQDNSGFRTAIGGGIASGLSRRGQFDALHGTINDRDIFHSYVPISHGGEVVGVFEVYRDLTTFHTKAKETRWLIALILGSALLTLFLVQVFVVRRMNSVLLSQEMALETYNRTLEARVAERTRKLVERDQALVQQQMRLQDEVRARTAELEQALLATEHASRAKSDFLSSMSHELRTPMNAILGFTQLLQYDESLPAEHQDNIQEILKAGQHLLALINEVLDLAKVESGNIDLSIEPVELAPVIVECLSLVSPLAQQRHVTITHESMAGLALRADRTRLKQVLINLISNAIKYNREGGSVWLEAGAFSDERLRVQIRDTGSGIAPERLAELFQPFNRLGADNSDIEGTGIGLTISRRVVEMMGGAIGVESEPGVGSTFWIELPLEAPVELGPALASTPVFDVADVSAASTTARVVLYIEDNPSNLKLVAQILGHVPNIQLLTAHTPELGIQLARERRPDIILLDINMPGMNGYQVMGVLQADPSTRQIPVVAITANAMRRDIQRGVHEGFVEYLTKPIDIARFNEVLGAYLPYDEHSSHEKS